METNPSQIKSLLNRSLDIVHLNKKRKLKAEQLGLPVSKHQCWKRILTMKPSTFGSIPDVEGFSPCTFKGKGLDIYDVSATVSDKDSNIFAENSDSPMSLQAEAKFGTEDAKYLLYDGAPSSSSDWGSSSQGSCYSLDGATVAAMGIEKVLSSSGREPEPANVELTGNLEESLLEYGSDIDYIYSGYGNYIIEQYQDKEIEEILDSNGANPNAFVLSSGRWSVHQEAPPTTRKPTIDQEFEQYFSMLML